LHFGHGRFAPLPKQPHDRQLSSRKLHNVASLLLDVFLQTVVLQDVKL
jgi:hypothetical protein